MGYFYRDNNDSNGPIWLTTPAWRLHPIDS